MCFCRANFKIRVLSIVVQMGMSVLEISGALLNDPTPEIEFVYNISVTFCEATHMHSVGLRVVWTLDLFSVRGIQDPPAWTPSFVQMNMEKPAC